MTRIRYTVPDAHGVCKSVKTISHPKNGAMYVVVLNVTTGGWRVNDAKSGIMARCGQHTNLHKSKIQITEALKDLGIPITVEKRGPREL